MRVCVYTAIAFQGGASAPPLFPPSNGVPEHIQFVLLLDIPQNGSFVFISGRL